APLVLGGHPSLGGLLDHLLADVVHPAAHGGHGAGGRIAGGDFRPQLLEELLERLHRPIVPDRYLRPSGGSARFHCAGTAYADLMQMIKFTHACVRLIDGERSLLIDPGIWAEAEAFDGVTDVLVTHEHADHVDVDRLVAAHMSNVDLRVYA